MSRSDAGDLILGGAARADVGIHDPGGPGHVGPGRPVRSAPGQGVGPQSNPQVLVSPGSCNRRGETIRVARLDEEAFGPLLAFYGAAGLAGLRVHGTTGEGILLGDEERRRVAELAVAGAGGLRVIVHGGAQTTAETSGLAAHLHAGQIGRPLPAP